ncbi:hypothetical protein HK096_004614, partial [Nowakowskiella sp. JEL0078]
MDAPPSEIIDVVEVFHDYQPPSGAGESLLAFRKGDILDVHAKDNTGWWHGTVKSSGQQGWFPSNYVRVCKPTALDPPNKISENKLNESVESSNHLDYPSQNNSEIKGSSIYSENQEEVEVY